MDSPQRTWWLWCDRVSILNISFNQIKLFFNFPYCFRFHFFIWKQWWKPVKHSLMPLHSYVDNSHNKIQTVHPVQLHSVIENIILCQFSRFTLIEYINWRVKKRTKKFHLKTKVMTNSATNSRVEYKRNPRNSRGKIVYSLQVREQIKMIVNSHRGAETCTFLHFLISKREDEQRRPIWVSVPSSWLAPGN